MSATFGECPATWLERQNLGTVLGQLGRPDEGKPLVEDALKRLRDYFGDDDPYVDMAQRNLEKLNASTD